MPTTYNGIGTHYYGRKHKKSRRAVCQQCGHAAELTSYETRLWFVFVFIPVIPLGRKHISDQCGVCSRHFVAPAKQWETSRQAQTAAAMEHFRKEQSEEAALEVHGTLIAFQQHEEAEQFRTSMLERFPEKPLLRAGLASHLETSGLPAEAAALWDDAYQLDPELPEARVGIAQRRMREGKLDEARELLSFLEQPGAEQQYSIDPLFDLAGYLQHGGQHEETLEVMQGLLTAYPQMASDHAIRKFIIKSEKALRRQESILPEVQHSLGKLFSSQYSSSQRWALGLTVAAILAAIGLAINNEYIRRHQPLTVINATGVAATVQVDDLPPVTIVGKQVISVAEGTRKIRISGPVDEQHELNVESSFWKRWSATPVWIVNVGGEAIIADMSVHYAVNPREPTVNMLVDPLIVRSHVDYLFEEPPDSMSVGSDRAVVTKTVLSWVDVGNAENSALGGFYTLQEYNKPQAWIYAARKLARQPNDESLLKALSQATTPAQNPQFRKLLEAKLDHRPVSIPWHRAWQDLPDVSRDYDQTIAVYDAMLQAEPRNAHLLYLRGRFESDSETGLEYMQRSRAVDPDLSWPDYAIGYFEISRGNWEQGLGMFDSALQKGFSENDITAARHLALLALRRLDEAETMHREHLQESPASLPAAAMLAEVLILSDRIDEAQQVVAQSVNSYRQQTQGRFPEAVFGTDALMAYYKGDLTASVQEAAKTDAMDMIRRMILIEQGNMEESVNSYQPPVEPDARWMPLLCSIGFYANGDRSSAEIWYRKSVEAFEALGPRYSAVTEILKAPEVTAEVVEKFRTLMETPQEKAIVLTSLGLRADSAGIRRRCFDEANSFLVRRHPPNGLLKKVQQESDPAP